MIRDLIKSMVPDVIKDSAIGDLVRFVRSVKNPTVDSTEDVSRTDPVREDTYSEPEPEEFAVEVLASQLLQWKEDGKEFVLLDIREPHELQYGFCIDSWIIPMNNIPVEEPYLPKDVNIVVACAAGVRSWSVAQYLRQQGFDNAWSLENGVPSWSEQGWVTPSKGKFSVGNQVRIPIEHDAGESEYGYVANISTVENELEYCIQVWSLDGGVQNIVLTEDELSHFVP